MRCFHLDQLRTSNVLRPLRSQPGPILGYLSETVTDGVPRDAHVVLKRVPATERSAADLLATLRWPRGWRCSACDHRDFGVTSRPRERRCRGCGKRQSVTSGTALHGKHDLRRWFAAAITLGSATQGSANRFAEVWGCDKKTAWATFHLLRRWAAATNPTVEEGAVVRDAFVGSGRCRPDKPTKPPRRLHNAGLLGGATTKYCHRAIFLALRENVTVTPFDEHMKTPFPQGPTEVTTVARHAALITDKVHGTVSPRWMPRYRGALVFRHNQARRGACPRRAFLLLALSAPKSPYRAMAPP